MPCFPDKIASDMRVTPQWLDWLRADRLATLWLSYPFHYIISSRHRLSVPILMYHSISKPAEKQRHPYFETATHPSVFAEHIKFLKDSGYRSVTLDEAIQYVESGRQDSIPRVVITFDDGFRDFYTEAFPVLDRYQSTATVFLPTSYIEEERRQFKNRECMRWSEVRELRKAGIDFGSHSLTHQQLRDLKRSEIDTELRCSKERIENELGCPVESFSYPFAFPETNHVFKAMLKDSLMAHGYKSGVTTAIGTLGARDDLYFMPRLPVNSWDDLALFRAKLSGAYNWIRSVQYVSKMCKS